MTRLKWPISFVLCLIKIPVKGKLSLFSFLIPPGTSLSLRFVLSTGDSEVSFSIDIVSLRRRLKILHSFNTFVLFPL